MAVSKLMASGLNGTAVNNCLQALKNYAAEDKGMKVFFSLYFFLSLTIFFLLLLTFTLIQLSSIPRIPL